jgi:hypothetical protein
MTLRQLPVERIEAGGLDSHPDLAIPRRHDRRVGQTGGGMIGIVVDLERAHHVPS